MDPAQASGGTPAFIATDRGQSECFQLLINAKANLDQALTSGVTPVFRASQGRQSECLKLLINAKASLDQAQASGATPAYIAAQDGQSECLQLLINAKADLYQAGDIITSISHGIVHLGSLNETFFDGSQLLYHLALQGAKQPLQMVCNLNAEP